jgi:hypothetical protein
LLSILDLMYIHPTDTSFNGVHWNKWDQRIKNMGKLYVDCVLLKGLDKMKINPSYPSESDLKKLKFFCDYETRILY